MFCIITPVFDGVFASIEPLISDLQNQTYRDFQHIMISNGTSPNIKEIIEKVNDNRFVYTEIPYEDTSKFPDLIVNLGKRRNFCIKTYIADRYFFFDADLLIIDNSFFEKIYEIHNKAELIISRINHPGMKRELPILPIQRGNIDIANYSFSRKIAERYDYPTDYNGDVANDWRFFDQIKENVYFSNILYAIKDGRNTYINLSALFIKWRTNRGIW